MMSAAKDPGSRSISNLSDSSFAALRTAAVPRNDAGKKCFNRHLENMRSMEIPVATYPIQFSLNFRFVDARDLVPYLRELGVIHLYASPRFKAGKGSSHGYDVADPLRINSELGTEEEFDEMVQKLKSYGMGL